MFSSIRVYTLKQGNKTLSVKHADRHYVIAFKNPIMARNIHYNIHPDPDITVIRGPTPETNNVAMLFIPKHTQGSPLDPLNDAGFHLAEMSYKDFLELPSKNNLGIILSYAIADESLDDTALNAIIIDSEYESASSSD